MRKCDFLLLSAVMICQVGCAPRQNTNQQPAGIEPVHLTDHNFEQEVVMSREPVLIDMWTPRCQPCIEMKPALRVLAADLAGRFKIAELNIDTNPFVKEKYQVDRYPLMLIFVDGHEVHRLPGLKTAEELKKS